MVDPKISGSYYRSLTRNIALIIVSVSVIPLVLITLTFRHYSIISYTNNIEKQYRLLSQRHQEKIDDFLNRQLTNISLLKNCVGFELLANDDVLQDKLKCVRENSGGALVDLGIINEQGVQIHYAGPYQLKNANYGQTLWFREARERPAYISDVFHGFRDFPHFIVAVRGQFDGATWFLKATVDFDKFNSLVENTRIGETGWAFILNRKGEFQTKTHTKPDLDREPYIRFLSSVSPSDQNDTVVEYSEVMGTGQIRVMSRLKGGDWALAFEQDEPEAYKGLYSIRTVTVLIFIIGVAVIVVVAVVLSRRLVSRIKQVDLEKEMMNEKVIEAGKLASVGELAAGIAHEINNPVAVMVQEAGWVQDIIDDAEPGSIPMVEEFEASMNKIRAQGARCKQITHKLLSFARKTDPVPKIVNINDVVHESIALCEHRVPSGSNIIQAEFAENLPSVRLSPSEAQQIFVNLINNALDEMELSGGLLKITTRLEGNNVVVDVSDNGPGIPDYILPRIFDPFFTTKPVGRGTGLGLSICHGIVKKWGGVITVNTAKGMGTTFHVKFPMSKRDKSRQ